MTTKTLAFRAEQARLNAATADECVSAAELIASTLAALATTLANLSNPAAEMIAQHQIQAETLADEYRRDGQYWRSVVVAMTGDDPDDHGPGCDGPLNCVCTPA